jgi:hypothetical protein
MINVSLHGAGARPRKVAVTVIALGFALLTATSASAITGQFGGYYHINDNGTRAYVDITENVPDGSNCVASASVVTSSVSGGQLQVGEVKCGGNANVDGTCSVAQQQVLFVERIPQSGGSPVCYPDGSGNFFTSYLMTVDDSSNNGTYWTYINGTQHEGQSGYSPGSVYFTEESEYTGGGCTTAWGASTGFSTWQYFNYAISAWVGIAQPSDSIDQCWTLGSYNSSAGSFTVSH